MIEIKEFGQIIYLAEKIFNTKKAMCAFPWSWQVLRNSVFAACLTKSLFGT